MGGDYTEGERGVLARIIHEQFCCNRGFAILAREAAVPVMLNYTFLETRDSPLDGLKAFRVCRGALYEERALDQSRDEPS